MINDTSIQICVPSLVRFRARETNGTCILHFVTNRAYVHPQPVNDTCTQLSKPSHLTRL